MDNNEPLTKLKQATVSHVTKHWDDTKTGLLLSQLGLLLRRDGIDVATTLQGRKLLDVLRTEMADAVVVERARSSPLTVGVFPKGSVGSIDVVELLERSAARTSDPMPRIAAGFWAAFTKPLDKSKERIVRLGPNPGFNDVDVGTADGALVVPESAICVRQQQDDASSYPKRVLESIQKWLAENKIGLDRVLASHARQDTHASESLLKRVLEALTTEQLRRINLPLDIVDVLSRR